jgi:4-oxalocrotonate tautomerase
MPILNVKISAAPSSELVTAISETLLELTTRILHKKRELTAIAIDFVPPEHWVVGGKTLAEQRKRSVYFDIKIVDGTNTKEEKAAYIAATFDAFTRLLGDLHDESYIYVQDVRADAYGYGGQTQEYRYVRGKVESQERTGTASQVSA